MVKDLKAPSEVVYKITSFSAGNILTLWENTRKFYIENVKKTFEELRHSKTLAISYFAEIQRRFIELLTRADGKSINILKYQQNFNKFLKDYPDLIEKEQAKDELH